MLVVEKSGGVIEVDNLEEICVDLVEHYGERRRHRSRPFRCAPLQGKTMTEEQKTWRSQPSKSVPRSPPRAACRRPPKHGCDTYNVVKARPAREMVLTADNPLGVRRIG